MAEHCCPEDKVDFHISGFGKQVVRLVVLFSYIAVRSLVLYLYDSSTYPIKGLPHNELFNVGVLAVHLEIPALEFLTKSRLLRLIDEGYFPSRSMLVRASVICHKEDRSRQILQDSVCLTLAHSPSEEKSFRNSNSLTNAELAPNMWLAELRDTVNHLVDLRKLGGDLADPFNNGKTFWSTDKIKSPKAPSLISLGLSHALTTGAE